MSGNDIEIQADFGDPRESPSILRMIHLRKKRYNFKNPLETLKNFKERRLRDFRRKVFVCESISIPMRKTEILVAGKRCISVGMRSKSTFEKSKGQVFSAQKILIRPKLLPKILRPGILKINDVVG